MINTKAPKILLVGAGRFGINHARNLSALLPKENVYIVDLVAETARQVAEQFAIPPTNCGTTLEAFLPLVDAVDISTQTDTHYNIGKIALEASKDVFIEKPMTVSSAEARELMELAERSDRILQPGHIYRFHPVTNWVKRHIEAGNLGEVIIVSGEFGGFKRPRNDVGGAYTDGIHFYDLAIHFFGALPNHVQAITRQFLPRGNPTLDDWANIFLSFDSEKLAHICTDYYYASKKREMCIVGKTGCIEVDFENRYAALYKQRHILENGSWKAVPGKLVGIPAKIEWIEPLELELRSFINSVITREPPIVPARDAYNLACIVEALYRSSGEKRQKEINY